jgi:uncharacterized lipoprotein YddW (UPF0748 family)
MEEMRGVWIANRPHSKVLESRENITEALEFLRSIGFNTIFPVVWNRGYTLFLSRVMENYGFPHLDPFYAQQQRDPLAEIISEAHRVNIKIIPWFEYGFAASHLADGGHILQQKPHWQAIDKDGATVRHGSLTWMNALNPEVQKFMLELILEVATQYDVDGIQGCDRLPALPVMAGYDRDTISLYQTEFGKLPPNNPQDKQWIQWRTDILTEFLSNLYRQVKTVNSQLIISMSPAVYPFCLQNLLQDSQKWLDRGIVDAIHPQIYRSSAFAYRQEVNNIQRTSQRELLTKFAPGIAFTANGKDLSERDILNCIEINRRTGLSGQIFFHYEGLRKNNNAIATALYKTGKFDRLASLPNFSLVR